MLDIARALRYTIAVIDVIDWGVREYADALAAQRALHARRVRGEIRDTLVFVEHPPVFTIGRQGGAGNFRVPRTVIESKGIPVVEIERGGDVTYHGPGQLVAYPVFLLPPGRRNIHAFVRMVEAAVTDTCRALGVPALTVEGLTGVWAGSSAGAPLHAPVWRGERKLASIGLAFRQWTSYHGLALNVNNDLAPFSFIHLCGLKGKQATSLALETGSPVDIKHVRGIMASRIQSLWEAFRNDTSRQAV